MDSSNGVDLQGRADGSSFHRKAVILCGAQDWAWQRITHGLNGVAGDAVLWVGDTAPADYVAVPPAHMTRHLGRECLVLVLDAHQGFHADVLAAALGTLRGGGVFYLLLPFRADWPGDRDPALARLAPWPLQPSAVGRYFFRRLRLRLETSGVFEIISPADQTTLPQPLGKTGIAWTLNPQQGEVAAAIERVALGHARRPLVLTADRGRGKSTAIGAALARLLRRGRQVVLCAPSKAAVDAVFQQLHRELPQGSHEGCVFSWKGGAVYFRFAHEQLHDPWFCDLLVIDEAAAIGLGMLDALSKVHNRLVFSTTVHGYEGSGRGFLLRFTRLLRRRMPQMRHMTLDRPVRWPPGDPLEQWLNETLLLEAEPRPVKGSVRPGFHWCDQGRLATDEGLLRQVFGLLVTAHYQTRPSDLHQLLDGAGLRLLLAMDDDLVLGGALVVEEGGFDPGLAAAVCRGERRPRGHLLLQSLAQHAGWCEAPTLRGLRVMRIAVQDGVRRQGIGLGMLAEIERLGRERGYDLLGTAYGLDEAVFPFWCKAGYRPVRVGYRVDPASGAHTMQMLKGLSTAGQALASAAACLFRYDLPLRLQRELRDLSPWLATELLTRRFHESVPESFGVLFSQGNSRGTGVSVMTADRGNISCGDKRQARSVQIYERSGLREGAGHCEGVGAHDLAVVHAFASAKRNYPDAYPSLRRWILTMKPEFGGEALSGLVEQVLLRAEEVQPSRSRIRQLRTWTAALLRHAQSG